MLDDVGFFASLAALVDGGRHLRLGLWVLAAAVTVLFNLDAAVVLLTPLYVRLAHRHGDDPIALAFIPALLASLASTVLPVSNLTNLVAAGHLDIDARDFLVQAAPAAVAATVVGLVRLPPGLRRPRSTCRRRRRASGPPGAADRRAGRGLAARRVHRRGAPRASRRGSWRCIALVGLVASSPAAAAGARRRVGPAVLALVPRARWPSPPPRARHRPPARPAAASAARWPRSAARCSGPT